MLEIKELREKQQQSALNVQEAEKALTTLKNENEILLLKNEEYSKKVTELEKIMNNFNKLDQKGTQLYSRLTNEIERLKDTPDAHYTNGIELAKTGTFEGYNKAIREFKYTTEKFPFSDFAGKAEFQLKKTKKLLADLVFNETRDTKFEADIKRREEEKSLFGESVNCISIIDEQNNFEGKKINFRVPVFKIETENQRFVLNCNDNPKQIYYKYNELDKQKLDNAVRMLNDKSQSFLFIGVVGKISNGQIEIKGSDLLP